MSGKAKSQIKDHSVIADALRPLFYRHEFARRNPDVTEHGKSVVRMFPLLDLAMGSESPTFFLGERKPRRTLVDLLAADSLKLKHEHRTEELRALGKYVAKHRVFPVIGRGASTFLPECIQYVPKEGDGAARLIGHEKEIYLVWAAFVDLDRFLIAEGLADRPCLLPVVPLNMFRGTPNKGDVGHKGIKGLAPHSMIVACDSGSSYSQIESNFKMLLIHLEASGRAPLVADALARAETHNEETKKQMVRDAMASQRNRCDIFNDCLVLQDFLDLHAGTSGKVELLHLFLEHIKQVPAGEAAYSRARDKFNVLREKAHKWLTCFAKIS